MALDAIHMVKCCRFCLHGAMSGMYVQCKYHRKTIPVFSFCNRFRELTSRNNTRDRKINFKERPFFYARPNPEITYSKLKLQDNEELFNIKDESI